MKSMANSLTITGSPPASERVEAPAEPRTDEELLLAYRDRGDHAAFVELVQRYERELYSYLRRYLADAVLAEDAFQGAFLQIHLKCDQYAEGRPFRPWLYTIATNQAIDAQRRNKRHKAASLDRAVTEKGNEGWSLSETLESREGAPLEAIHGDEQRQLVREAVDELPESQRSVVSLVYFQGLKYREAANVLGIPVGTVKSRLHAAVQRLHSVFQFSTVIEGDL